MRYYDPAAGHFLSADPLGHGATWDLYSAFSGDPINRFDPDGRFTRVAWAAGTGFAEGAGEGLWNEVIGVGHFAKGMSYDLGQQVSLTAFDTFEAYTGGDQFESAAFQGVYNMALEGNSNADMAGELALNVSGYRFGNQIFESYEQGAETGDYSQFSQNMGTFAAIAVSSAMALERPPDPFRIEPYDVLRRDTSAPGQAHHLNQSAAYRDVIPRGEGMSIKLEGNAFTDVGSPHYNAHATMEQFWQPFRETGELPTNLQYTQAMRNSLRNAGLSEQQVTAAVRAAIRERVNAGELGGMPVPRVPNRLNQVKLQP
jgi:hypothetical protein